METPFSGRPKTKEPPPVSGCTCYALATPIFLDSNWHLVTLEFYSFLHLLSKKDLSRAPCPRDLWLQQIHARPCRAGVISENFASGIWRCLCKLLLCSKHTSMWRDMLPVSHLPPEIHHPLAMFSLRRETTVLFFLRCYGFSVTRLCSAGSSWLTAGFTH